MKGSVPINLASQPFRRERAELAILASIGAALTISLLVFVVLILQDRRDVSAIRGRIRADQQTLAAVERQQAQSQKIIVRPDNADVFSKSVFYNQLISRRAVSWTRVFDDLTRVMPADVQLIALRLPQVAAENSGDKNHVELDMHPVIGKFHAPTFRSLQNPRAQQ